MVPKRRHLLLSSAQSLSDESVRSKKLKRKDPGITNDDASARVVTVKDLRSRRIFSPAKIDEGMINGLGFRVECPKSLGSDASGDNELGPNLLSDMKGESNGPVSNGIGIGLDDYRGSQRNDSDSRCKSVVKSSLRRKVFKAPGSHSYSRLLPFLMDMVKDDTCSFTDPPCILKTEKFGLEAQNSKDEDKGVHSDGLRTQENEEMKNYGSELSCEAQNLGGLNLSKTVGDTQSFEVLKVNENGLSSSGIDESTEEHKVPKIDKINLGISSNSPKSNGTTPKFSCLANSNDPKGEDEGEDSLEPLENGNVENFSTLLSREDPVADQLNLSGSGEDIQLDNQDQKRNENGECSNGVGIYTENIQMTPPDMNIFSDPEMKMTENEESPKKNIAKENNNIACGNTHKDICLMNSSILKKKVVLNPCSRKKVFKTPGSFSYRRLLPYLMDVSNDNPSNSLDASKFPRHAKVKIDPEEKKANMHLHMVDIDSQQTTEHPVGDLLPIPPTTIPISNVDSSDNEPTLVSAEKSIELLKPFDSPNKCTLPIEQVISDVLKDLKHSSGDENSEIEKTSTAILSCSSGNNETIHRDDVQYDSSQGTKALELECWNQKSSRVESFSFNNPDNSKGILRRNPRGCRGLCHCLNCTSFRLNADRAFEFSRNQMLDAEEVALDLIKELSGLRNILKSTVNSHGQVTGGIDQVKETCTKALKAEESAKCRLKEMHCDLRAHCRSKLLERPRVRFANYVKETLIPQVNSPAGDGVSYDKIGVEIECDK